MDDPWSHLKRFTEARIGLTRAGTSVTTKDSLTLQLAFAEAREAVWRFWDHARLTQALNAAGQSTVTVRARVQDRKEYLVRPDLGRRIATDCVRELAQLKSESDGDVVFVVADGLSAKAIDNHFLPFWTVLRPRLVREGFTLRPLVLAPYGRVAIADEIGEIFGAKISVICIGERPGLSSSDSLGLYLTYGPKIGNRDHNRNCISSVRPPRGLDYGLAADRLIYLIRESLSLKISGVHLKEDAPRALNDTRTRRGSLLPS